MPMSQAMWGVTSVSGMPKPIERARQEMRA
jgi:hypothetical protein